MCFLLGLVLVASCGAFDLELIIILGCQFDLVGRSSRPSIHAPSNVAGILKSVAGVSNRNDVLATARMTNTAEFRHPVPLIGKESQVKSNSFPTSPRHIDGQLTFIYSNVQNGSILHLLQDHQGYDFV
jgi:hypothetical protein